MSLSQMSKVYIKRDNDSNLVISVKQQIPKVAILTFFSPPLEA